MAFSLFLILISVLLGVAGELLLKSGIDQVGDLKLNGVSVAAHTAWNVISTPRILIGFTCYGLAAITWLIVLSKLDLSYAYPMLALTYVLIPLAARIFLKETIPPGRWIGIVVVVIGVAIVAWYGRTE